MTGSKLDPLLHLGNWNSNEIIQVIWRRCALWAAWHHFLTHSWCKSVHSPAATFNALLWKYVSFDKYAFFKKKQIVWSWMFQACSWPGHGWAITLRFISPPPGHEVQPDTTYDLQHRGQRTPRGCLSILMFACERTLLHICMYAAAGGNIGSGLRLRCFHRIFMSDLLTSVIGRTSGGEHLFPSGQAGESRCG